MLMANYGRVLAVGIAHGHRLALEAAHRIPRQAHTRLTLTNFNDSVERVPPVCPHQLAAVPAYRFVHHSAACVILELRHDLVWTARQFNLLEELSDFVVRVVDGL